MKISNYFKPRYDKLLLIIAGVLIGLTPNFVTWLNKTLVLAVAIGMVLLSEKARRIEEDKIKNE